MQTDTSLEFWNPARGQRLSASPELLGQSQERSSCSTTLVVPLPSLIAVARGSLPISSGLLRLCAWLGMCLLAGHFTGTAKGEPTPVVGGENSEIVSPEIPSEPSNLTPAASDETEAKTDETPVAKQEQIPPDKIVKAGIKTLGLGNVGPTIQRGEILVSGGNDGRIAGTLIYPVRVQDFPDKLYFSRDEFGEWFVASEARRIPVPTSLGEKHGGDENAGKAISDSSNPKEVAKQLDTVKAKIQAEKKRWSAASAVINRLTNNKKTPVQEGTQAYFQCLEASKVMQAVEANAELLKKEKARLEELARPTDEKPE